MNLLRTTIYMITMAFMMNAAAHAQEKEVEVLHWWTSSGEAAAMQVFSNAFTEAGGIWNDTAIVGGDKARTTGVNRIVAKDAPSVMQFNTGKQFERLVSDGLLHDVDSIAVEEIWREYFPKFLVDDLSRDGKFYAVPISVHGNNWLWANKAVLSSVGVDMPKSYQDIIDAAPILREAGIIPLALGGQDWQERLMFNSVLLAEAGAEVYFAANRNNDIETIRGDDFRRAAEMFMALRDLIDENSKGRNWNDATQMVINGKAAMQVMGDWAKGEFVRANLVLGEDFECEVLGDNGYIVGGDTFVFPVIDAELSDGQRTLATLMMLPDMQVAFNVEKGSLPARLDADLSGMDKCAQRGHRLLADPAMNIPTVDYLVSPDFTDVVDDVVSEFWNTPSMTVNDFLENYIEAIEEAG